jgi:hypothetical protein
MASGRLIVTMLLGALAACADEPVVDLGDVRVVDLAGSTATEGWAVNYPKQRKVLFIGDRLWLFYSDGADLLARTTTDGETLTTPFVVWEDAVFGHRCALAYDGASLHAACCLALPGADVLYRRGTPSEDGLSIAWDGEAQIAFDVPHAQSVLYPKVLVDASGRPWVAFMLFEGGFETAPQRAMVSRSSRTDGVWETASGFPFALSAPSAETFPDPLGVALASGGTYWIWDPDGESHYVGRPWSEGAGFGPEERISEGRHRHGLFDAVADGDDVHVSYGGGAVHYRHRDASGRWSPERTVTSRGSGHTSIASLGGGRALVTWLDPDRRRIVQREMSDESSGPATLVLDAATDGVAGRLHINLNGLEAPAGPFHSAITATLGTMPPYRVVLATRPEHRATD